METRPPPRGLQLFRPPYRACEPIDPAWRPAVPEPGAAVVWFISLESACYAEMDWLWDRPRSLPLFIVLPEPEDVPPLAGILRSVPELGPRGVLPTVATGTMTALRVLLAAPPRSLSQSTTELLGELGCVPDVETRDRIETIFARARAASISSPRRSASPDGR